MGFQGRPLEHHILQRGLLSEKLDSQFIEHAASYRNATLIWFLTILLHKPDDIALFGVLCDPLVNIESSLWIIPASKVLSSPDETAV